MHQFVATICGKPKNPDLNKANEPAVSSRQNECDERRVVFLQRVLMGPKSRRGQALK